MSVLDQMRKTGDFAQLSDGKVRYELSGPKNGPTVVLIHGLMGHLHVWDHQAEVFAANGFQVLRFDLYGRGFSDRVDRLYGSELFMAQVTDLLAYLGLTEPIHLFGLSMGGAISTRFASHHPEKVKSIFLSDCYGIPTPDAPGIRLVRPKLVGEAVMGLVGGAILRKAPARGVFDRNRHDEYLEWFSAPMTIKGSKRALLSTLRHFMLEDHVPHYQRLNHLAVPKLMLWGRQDRVLPYEYGKRMHALMPNARFETFEQCGHVPQFEHPEKFNALALDWLREHE